MDMHECPKCGFPTETTADGICPNCRNADENESKAVAGQIVSVSGTPVAIVGETLADVLDIDNWEETREGKVVNPGKGPSQIIIGGRK